ncbi:Uncharacterized protein PBTT_03961 [Plasmodiophora brassicae]
MLANWLGAALVIVDIPAFGALVSTVIVPVADTVDVIDSKAARKEAVAVVIVVFIIPNSRNRGMIVHAPLEPFGTDDIRGSIGIASRLPMVLQRDKPAFAYCSSSRAVTIASSLLKSFGTFSHPLSPNGVIVSITFNRTPTS